MCTDIDGVGWADFSGCRGLRVRHPRGVFAPTAGSLAAFGFDWTARQCGTFRRFVVSAVFPGCGGLPRRGLMLVMSPGWSAIS